MKTFHILKGITFGLALVAGSLVLTRCTKQNETASQLDRSLTATDSTVFAQYYDSTIISTADVTPDVNDVIRMKGVASIIQSRCATVNCHGGAIGPKLSTYDEVKALTVPGNPESSELFRLVTTNDFHKAMPPVYAGELTTSEKVIIYNWIKNGSKDKPSLEDFRPAAMKLIVSGCASVQCHNSTVLTGDWARKGLLAPLSTSDTTIFNYTSGGAPAIALELNRTKSDQIWAAYKDSARKFFPDTVANASFRPYKTLSTPVGLSNKRSPLNNYDDVLFDIWYPKNVRTNSAVVFTNTAGTKFYCRGNYLVSTDCFIRRIDSTLIYTYTNNLGVVTDASKSGNMAWDDSHWSPSEIALVKAWYFADNNIPDVWKYGVGNQGMFRYAKTNNKITKK